MQLRTNKGRKLDWRGGYSRSGRCIRCYAKGGDVYLIRIATGEAMPGVNTRRKRAGDAATQQLSGDEIVPPEAIRAALAHI